MKGKNFTQGGQFQVVIGSRVDQWYKALTRRSASAAPANVAAKQAAVTT